jgi:hypothetical protein
MSGTAKDGKTVPLYPIMIRRYLLIIALLMLVATPFEISAQCAMCKEAAESSMKSDPNSMARSLNKGILYLMAVPYLMIAFIFRKQLYHLWKRAGKRFFRTRQIQGRP